MSAVRSLQVWTVYVFAIGISLLLVPNVILGLFRIPETDEVWIRVVGVVVIALGVLYWSMVQRDDSPGMLATVYERYFAAAAFVVLAFTTGPWQLVLFGVIDFLGASWTLVALRSKSSVRQPA
ncbi:MAG: hypothetical protein ACLFWH_04740 [Actinomycetota bacterium]